ncbi:hypothetical protein EVAR_62558_1 [Eumeta japonica]|uniref:Uncharacterized protein n=1 Tax=Eumeta variegata TaxID=151549 RepID=A0A4C1YRE3_EUMVA|nr:hypothetical protein EVAR_62558_1 [Eumeta japonica]
MSFTREEPRETCCARYFDRIYRSKPNLPCARATFSVHLRRASMVRTLLYNTEEKDQAQHNIVLRMFVGAGRYVLNDGIARDLRIEISERNSSST